MLHIFKSYFCETRDEFDLTTQIYKKKHHNQDFRESIDIAHFVVNGHKYSFEYSDRFPNRNWDTLEIYLIDGEEKILLYSETGTLYCLNCTDRVNFKMPGKWWNDLDQIKEGMCKMNRLALLKFEEKRRQEQIDLYETYRKLEERLFNA